jgi:hypothetical protein
VRTIEVAIPPIFFQPIRFTKFSKTGNATDPEYMRYARMPCWNLISWQTVRKFFPSSKQSERTAYTQIPFPAVAHISPDHENPDSQKRQHVRNILVVRRCPSALSGLASQHYFLHEQADLTPQRHRQRIGESPVKELKFHFPFAPSIPQDRLRYLWVNGKPHCVRAEVSK